MYRGSRHLGKINGHFSPTVPPSAAGCSRVWHAWRRLVGKVGTSNQDRTISLKAAVRSCTNKQPWQRPVTTWVYKPEVANTV